jgi:hypothetical protein
MIDEFLQHKPWDHRVVEVTDAGVGIGSLHSGRLQAEPNRRELGTVRPRRSYLQ